MEDNSQQGVVHNTCARTYDPSIGRWLTQDPMAEKYYAMTPYNYCGNDPINLVDKDGNSTKNIKEALFAVTHPFATKRIGVVRLGRNCTNISTNAVRFSYAGNVLDKRDGVDEGSQIGSFRHTLWQAQITSEFGDSTALKVGNAHENGLFQITEEKDDSYTIGIVKLDDDQYEMLKKIIEGLDQNGFNENNA